MSGLPYIALMEPEGSFSAECLALFDPRHYLIRRVPAPQDVIDLAGGEDGTFDCIVVPLALSQGRSGASALMALRAEPLTAPIPMVALSPIRERAALSGLFEAGADAVLAAPFDSELIRLQIVALGRQRRLFTEDLTLQLERAGLTTGAVGALHLSRDAILILDRALQPIFANIAAIQLLNLDPQNLPGSYAPIEGEIRSAIDFHLARERRAITDSAAAGHSPPLSLTLRKADGVPMYARTATASLVAPQGQLLGYAVHLTDIGPHQLIAHRLRASEQSQAHAITLASGCLHALQSAHLGRPGFPLQLLQQRFEEESPRARVNAVIDSVLEMIDILTPPDTTITVKSPRDWEVPLRPAHLFQILGHLLLDAADFAGASGETGIEVADRPEEKGISITVTAVAPRITAPIPGDPVAALAAGDYQALHQSAHAGAGAAQLTVAKQEALRLCKRYGVIIETQQAAEWERRTRVRMPALALQSPTGG